MRLIEIAKGTATLELEPEDLFALARACADAARHTMQQPATGALTLYDALTVAMEGMACAAAASVHMGGAEEDAYSLTTVRQRHDATGSV